ncbi:hypothetical protein SLS58_002899 [Diplodia intermedia]|uniref:Sacsin/Nov domain-containing protein n=1 Tax=Diplodia intermedia TaxID=856260 RepID=A0ABR3TY33_9PEZI
MPVAITTREQAEEWLAQIRSDHGGLSQDDEAGMRRDYPKAWQALQSGRRKLASATKTLITDLYSTDTRFLYELIQNADDNGYSRAEANCDDPFISFSLYPDQLVIDSNEDGFTTEDVQAICGVGRSTKSTARGYIGERGIGFKSVFKVAHRVHVQSGLYSFSFQYTRDSGDDGLGMVTPSIEPHDDLPEDVSTRITLMLLDDTGFGTCFRELTEISDPLLLFLRKLRYIQVNTYPAAGDTCETIYSNTRGKENDPEMIEIQSSRNSGPSTVVKSHFLVTRRTIYDLPNGAARKPTNQAEVVLAFPISSNANELVLKEQGVFAYLPLRPVGFKFLIQSDFITQTGHEDIGHHPRNEALRTGVANAFLDAVRAFNDHEKLQYQWMRYLPDERVSDTFWKRLGPEIADRLAHTPVLKSWSGRLCYLGQLMSVPPNARDKYGEPLLADLEDEGYLAPQYSRDDVRRLQLFEIRLTIYGFVYRLEADLARPDSKMMAFTTENDWHSRVADFLFERFEKDSMRIKSLSLLPLADGRWTTSPENFGIPPVYFPTLGPSKIPTDLGFRLIHPEAAKNPSRRRLFAKLGVIDCEPNSVVSAIYREHSAGKALALGHTISHLRFLFFNLPACTSSTGSVRLLLQNRKGTVDPRSERAYFPDSDDEYDAQRVFQPRFFFQLQYPAKFIHPDYLTAVPSESRRNGLSFATWLENVVGVKRIPQIHQASNGLPSEELEYILNHRPEILLGLLRKHWFHYAPVVTEAIEKRLRESEVPSQYSTTVRLRLQGSYMPLPKLKALAEACGCVNASLFVQTPSNLRDEDEESWKFLTRFGVRFVDDVDFYMKLLDSIASVNRLFISTETEEAIIKIYSAMMRKCVTEGKSNSVR